MCLETRAIAKAGLDQPIARSRAPRQTCASPSPRRLGAVIGHGGCPSLPRLRSRRSACWRPGPRRLASAPGSRSRGGAAAGLDGRVADARDELEERAPDRCGHLLRQVQEQCPRPRRRYCCPSRGATPVPDCCSRQGAAPCGRNESQRTVPHPVWLATQSSHSARRSAAAHPARWGWVFGWAAGAFSASSPSRPRAAPADAATPLLTSGCLPLGEHFTEPPGADVIDKSPDWNLLRDPWV